MKKKIIFGAMLMMAVCSTSFAASSEYVVDDTAIEATINNGTAVASLTPSTQASAGVSASMLSMSGENTTQGPVFASDKSAMTAMILAFFLGSLGIHRFYMGTATLTGVGYILTLGGCGIVSLVDWVVLLIAAIDNKSISDYIDNPKFFMWSGK
jgi:TM2 domain-containing membrane protein YozV